MLYSIKIMYNKIMDPLASLLLYIKGRIYAFIVTYKQLLVPLIKRTVKEEIIIMSKIFLI